MSEGRKYSSKASKACLKVASTVVKQVKHATRRMRRVALTFRHALLAFLLYLLQACFTCFTTVLTDASGGIDLQACFTCFTTVHATVLATVLEDTLYEALTFRSTADLLYWYISLYSWHQ
jgi:hypothetical protein